MSLVRLLLESQGRGERARTKREAYLTSRFIIE